MESQPVPSDLYTDLPIYLPTDPQLRESCGRAFSQSKDILASPDGQRALSILPSVRRIHKLYGLDLDIILSQRKNDILYDLRSFEGQDLSSDELDDLLSILQSIETSYYTVAEQLTVRRPSDEKVYDKQWEIFLAQQRVRDILWLNWKPPEDVQDQPISLYAHVKTNFRYFLVHLLRSLPPNKTIMYQEDQEDIFEADDFIVPEGLHIPELEGTSVETESDMFEEYSDEQQYSPLHAYRPVYENVRSATSELQHIISNLSLEQVFTILAHLSPRERRAVLILGGYIQRKNKSETDGTGRWIYEDDIKQAVKSLQQLNIPSILTRDKIPPQIQDVLSGIEQRPLYRMGDRILHFDSPRITLLESNCLQDKEFLHKLTPIELRILRYALRLEGQTFVRNNEEVAALAGTTANVVEEALTQFIELLQTGISRYVDTDGNVIREGSAVHTLITLQPTLTTDQRAALSQLQSDTLDFFTTPDENGRYRTLKMATQAGLVRDGSFATKILETVQDSEIVKEIEMLRLTLEIALQNLELFDEKQTELIKLTYGLITEGKPLRGHSGGIGYIALSRAVGMPDHFAPNFFKILLPNRLNKTTENQEGISLIRKSQAGNPEAFAMLYEKYADKIYDFCNYKLQNTNLAEDITAQTFTQALAAIHTYQFRAPFSAWLYTIARNLISDHYRHNKTVVVSLTKTDAEEDEYDIPDIAESPEKLAEFAFENTQLTAALDQLTDEQKAVVILKFFEGYTNMEVANIMRKTESAIKALQRRALASLRDLLEYQGGY